MSKIFNVRLPNAVSTVYDPQQFNQLVRSLEQIVLQLNSSYTSIPDQNNAAAQAWFANAAGAGGFAGGIRGFQLSNGISLPYGMFMNTSSQSNPDPTAENILTFNQTNFANGIRVVDNSKIYVPCAGQYLVTMTLQSENGENDIQTLDLWAKNTGVNYDYSNRRFSLQPRKSSGDPSERVAVTTGIFTVGDPANDYLQMAWRGSTTNVSLVAYAASSSPTRPAVPSAILTINFISAE